MGSAFRVSSAVVTCIASATKSSRGVMSAEFNVDSIPLVQPMSLWYESARTVRVDLFQSCIVHICTSTNFGKPLHAPAALEA